jgi:hypothetical protein
MPSWASSNEAAFASVSVRAIVERVEEHAV